LDYAADATLQEATAVPDTPADLFAPAMEQVDPIGPGDIRLTQVAAAAGHLIASHSPFVSESYEGPEHYLG
jgi:hypothetical protein